MTKGEHGLMRVRWAAFATLCATLVLLGSCGGTSLNPTPVISALYPETLPATLIGPPACNSNPSFTLNLGGNNFITTSVAYWNGSQRATTYNQTTGQLTVTILACDIATPGVAYISVVNPPPGGGPTQNAATFQITQPNNPTPSISSLSPASVAKQSIPSTGLTLTINGSGFVSASQAAVNGNLRATTFVSSTELQIQLTQSDDANVGTLTISVTNPSPGGGTSSAQFSVTDPPNPGDFPQVVSVSATGGPANGASSSPAMSSDGRYVAFYSEATNLVASGASGNIFVRDTCVGATSCTPHTTAVDIAPDGSAPDAVAGEGFAISGSGRYVAFASSAKNLVPMDKDSFVDDAVNVFVRDLCLGSDTPTSCEPHTTLVSQTVAGGPPTATSALPSISADGRFVAFLSTADDLAGGLSGSSIHIFVRDTCAGVSATTSCAPQTFGFAADSANADVTPYSPMISANGRYVAFEAVHHAAGGAAGHSEIVLLDTCLGSNSPVRCTPSATTSVSVLSDGSPIIGWNVFPSVSADGRFVAFSSSPLGSGSDVWVENLKAPSASFVRDTCLGSTAPAGCAPSTVSLEASDANGTTNWVYAPQVSPSGRFVTFSAGIVNESSSDPLHWQSSLMVRDNCIGASNLCTSGTYPLVVRRDATSRVLTGDMMLPVPLDVDGRIIAFSSAATNLAAPTSGLGDVFLTLMPSSQH